MGDARQDGEPAGVTDPRELDRLAARAERSTRRFRAWVLSGCALRDDELEAVVRETADAVWKRIDCVECGKCCHTRNVTVDAADIRRLAGFLGITQPAFRRRYVRPVGGELAIRAGPCPFLDGCACTVYVARPAACRDFPYLHAPGFRRRVLYLMDLAHLCPIVYFTLEALKKRLPWREEPGP